MRHLKPFRSALSAAILATLGINGVPAFADVEHGNIQVIQNDVANATTSVTVTKASGTTNFAIRDGSNRGDYNVTFGTANDQTSGVLLTAVRQNGRDNSLAPNIGGYNGLSGTVYATSTIDRSADLVSYFIPIHHAPAGDETNMDVAVGFFRYEDGWLGGLALNLNPNGTFSNNNALNTFIGSAGINIGTEFVDPITTTGIYTLNLGSLGSSQNGILIVNGAKNEDNYALCEANADGTFTIICHDNGANARSYENDPVAFVYIPNTSVNLTAGRVLGDGTQQLAINGGTGAATVVQLTDGDGVPIGRYRLTIAGQSPATGTLLISPEGGSDTTNNLNVDNIVTYQADGDGWIIESRDLPNAPLNLQAVDATEGCFSFVFLPNSGGIAPRPVGNTVSGTVVLPSELASVPLNRPLTLTFVPTTGDPIVQTVTPDANGSFTSAAVPAGSYRVIARTDFTLSDASTVDLSDGSVTGLSVNLRGGDATNDNAVDIADLLLLIGAYNKTSADPEFLAAADFDFDNANDIADLLILIGNYNQLGRQ